MKTVIVKLGGEVVASPEMGAIAAGLRALVAAWHRVAVVHGGGPQASALQKRLGQEPRIVAGKRVTDEAALEVMKYVVAGQVNADLCAKLLAAGVVGLGLHGASGHAIRARRRPPASTSGCCLRSRRWASCRCSRASGATRRGSSSTSTATPWRASSPAR
jgi:acetylglutamate kinase